MHFNQHVYLMLSPSPSLTLHQWRISHKQQKRSAVLHHHQLHVPFLNQYLPSADKLYNFLTVRGMRRWHIYFPLAFFSLPLIPCFCGMAISYLKGMDGHEVKSNSISIRIVDIEKWPPAFWWQRSTHTQREQKHLNIQTGIGINDKGQGKSRIK